MNILTNNVFQIMAFIANIGISALIYIFFDEDKNKEDSNVKMYAIILIPLFLFMMADPFIVQASVINHNETDFINLSNDIPYDEMMNDYNASLGKRVKFIGKVSDLTHKGDVNIFTLDVNDAKVNQIAVYAEGDVNIQRGNEIIVYGIIIEKSEILDTGVLYPTVVTFYTKPKDK
jgi:hypothetical protein